MATLEYLAREFKFSASNDGTTWTEIGGLSKWGWKEDTNTVETTDFDDNGGYAQMSSSIKYSLMLDGNLLIDAATGARDAGQKLVEKAARALGPAGYVFLKIEPRDAALDGSIEAQFSVKLTDRGGGNDDKLPWGVEAISRGTPAFSGIFDPDAA
jgi:hypothetical protein